MKFKVDEYQRTQTRQPNRRDLAIGTIGLAASYVFDAIGLMIINPPWNKLEFAAVALKAVIISGMLIWRSRIR